MKIAIFNPGRSWDNQAWALVSDDEQAHDIGVANGFYSWKLYSESEVNNGFKRMCKQLA